MKEICIRESITGGVGAGKSSVLEYIESNYKCEIIYADLLAAKLQQKGQVCYESLICLLGEDVVDENGEIDRKKTAEIVFGNPDILEKVNNIVHPAVKDYIVNRISELRQENFLDYLFIEAALLIECGYKSIVDEMWYVYAAEDVRRLRLKESRGYNDSKIDSILKSQLSEEEFKASSDVIIDNSGDINDTIEQIRECLYEC